MVFIIVMRITCENNRSRIIDLTATSSPPPTISHDYLPKLAGLVCFLFELSTIPI